MKSFGNFLKSLSESLNIAPTNNNDDSVSREEQEAANRTRRINAVRHQALEDDDEEYEAKGARREPNFIMPNNPRGGISTGAVVGLAALAIGGYVIGKTYFSKDKKLSETKEEIIEKLKEIEKDAKEFPVIGFDCQWSASYDGAKRNKIALIQIASHKGTVLLIQLNKLYTFHEELKTFLKNRYIIKSGIETSKDARYLLEDYGLVVTGTFDLRFLAEETGHRPESLAKLANKILGIEIDRDWDLIASDWSKDTLDEDQLNYAEKAAKASVDIFKALIPYVTTNVNRSEILNYCSEYLDRNYVYYSQNY